jgi:predicted O-linked N-acetylglucosamine transferase (SPINDLY family)
VDQHLARHRQADLFLDTYYYNAHTTASDALYMGLPVLTCPGDSFASRVGQSLVTAAGIPELIVTDLQAYEETAVRLAENPEELNAIKQRLTEQTTTCPLFDTARFVKNLEKAYREIWRRYQAGETPRMITIED